MDVLTTGETDLHCQKLEIVAIGQTDLQGQKMQVVAIGDTDLEDRAEIVGRVESAWLRKWERLSWWKEGRWRSSGRRLTAESNVKYSRLCERFAEFQLHVPPCAGALTSHVVPVPRKGSGSLPHGHDASVVKPVEITYRWTPSSLASALTTPAWVRSRMRLS